MANTVLIIEDDDALRGSLAQTLELEDITPIPTSSFVQARRTIRSNFAGVILSDIRMPHQDGFSVLGFAQSVDTDLPVILLTGQSDVPTAMRAMREGAYDYLEKPCSTERLLEVLRRALSHRALVLRNRKTEQMLRRSDPAAMNFPGSSPASTDLRATLRDLAEARRHVHLHGPAGVGKKMAAYTINAMGSDKPEFRAVNLDVEPDRDFSALDLPDGPLDLSVKNFERATDTQIDALIALLWQMPDLRLITSSRSDLINLPHSAARSQFINSVHPDSLRLPDLVDRQADLGKILETLLRQTVRSMNLDMPELPQSVYAEVMSRSWPGNLPELRAFCVEYMSAEGTGSDRVVQPLSEQMDAFERLVLIDTLKRSRGKAAQAAEALGLPRKTFYDRLARHGLRPKDYKSGGA